MKGEAFGELTAREKEVLLKVSAGASNEEIADELRIDYHRVKAHLHNIYRKLQVNNRFQATAWAAQNLRHIPDDPRITKEGHAEPRNEPPGGRGNEKTP